MVGARWQAASAFKRNRPAPAYPSTGRLLWSSAQWGKMDGVDAQRDDWPNYLQPYAQTAARYGARFESLLWSSPRTQSVRLEAMTRLTNFRDRSVCDAGAGRGDLLRFLTERDQRPMHYVAVEAEIGRA